MYVVLSYLENGQVYIHNWFNDYDYFICSAMAILYGFTLYVKQHRIGYAISRESLLYLTVVCPILLSKSLAMN